MEGTQSDMNKKCRRVAILYPGNNEVRRNATHENNRFSGLFRAFAAKEVQFEPTRIRSSAGDG